MRILTFEADGGARAGVLVAGRVLDICEAARTKTPSTVRELIASQKALSEVRGYVRCAQEDLEFLNRFSIPLGDVRLLAPIPRPGKVICLGLNYRDHAEESGADVPCEPVIFCKASTSVIGPWQSIVLPQASQKVDYEVELAFVIGKQGRGVPAARAMEHVLGYTVLNDVSARDYQREKPGGQWFLAKSFDTFCPMGPWIVTADEIGDPHNLQLSCEVNGQVMQASSTAQMVFRIPEIIEYISRVFTLEAGDVVATGTPSGVGFARRPPSFLRSGDVVVCTVEKVGTLQNPVR